MSKILPLIAVPVCAFVVLALLSEWAIDLYNGASPLIEGWSVGLAIGAAVLVELTLRATLSRQSGAAWNLYGKLAVGLALLGATGGIVWSWREASRRSWEARATAAAICAGTFVDSGEPSPSFVGSDGCPERALACYFATLRQEQGNGLRSSHHARIAACLEPD